MEISPGKKPLDCSERAESSEGRRVENQRDLWQIAKLDDFTCQIHHQKGEGLADQGWIIFGDPSEALFEAILKSGSWIRGLARVQ